MIKRTSFGLSSELIEKFNKLCKARQYERSEIIERLIKAYIDDADKNGWTEYIETKCIACNRIFQQPRINHKKWCSRECHLLSVILNT